jgi:hypothetical protein
MSVGIPQPAVAARPRASKAGVGILPLRGLVALAALAAALLPAPRARAQEATVSLRFTDELISWIATDNQGERTGEIVDRIIGLSPAVQTVRLQRAGGRISLFFTATAAAELPVSFQLTLDKMAYYRMRTARTDVAGVTAALQEAKAAEPLVRGAAYRYDGRYSIIDLTLDLRPAIEEARQRRARLEAEARAAAEAKAAAEEKAAAEAKAAEAARRAKATAAAVAASKAAEEARATAEAARATAAAAAAAAAKAEGEARAAAEAARATAAAAKTAAGAGPAGPAPAAGPLPAQRASSQETTRLSAKALGSETAPVVDGQLSDPAWQGAPWSSVGVAGASGNLTLTAGALWSPDRLWIFVRWPDGSRDDLHHPWVWSQGESVYFVGPQVEDALSLSFAREGRMGECMLAGAEAATDLWTWRAGRSDFSGYAEDATMTLSFQQQPRANSFQARNGSAVWVRIEPDAGSRPYQTQIAGAYAGDLIPRYSASVPSGSMADVRAKGAWKEGFWTVEFSRRLSTGDPADAVFGPGSEITFAIAVFDSREGINHSNSKELTLKLEPPRP